MAHFIVLVASLPSSILPNFARPSPRPLTQVRPLGKHNRWVLNKLGRYRLPRLGWVELVLERVPESHAPNMAEPSHSCGRLRLRLRCSLGPNLPGPCLLRLLAIAAAIDGVVEQHPADEEDAHGCDEVGGDLREVRRLRMGSVSSQGRLGAIALADTLGDNGAILAAIARHPSLSLGISRRRGTDRPRAAREHLQVDRSQRRFHSKRHAQIVYYQSVTRALRKHVRSSDLHAVCEASGVGQAWRRLRLGCTWAHS